MSDAQEREMTLDEWVGRLPECHLVNRELAALKAENERLRWQIRFLWRIHAKTKPERII